MSGNNSGAGQFSSSLKYSVHRFSCSSTVFSGFTFLSFTGMSVCWNLPTSFLVVRYRSLKYPDRLLHPLDWPGDGCSPFPDAPLHFPICCCVFCLCLWLSCSCPACVQAVFFTLTSGWCQRRSIPGAGPFLCPGLLHMCPARVFCSPPTVSQGLSHTHLSAPVVAGTWLETEFVYKVIMEL